MNVKEIEINKINLLENIRERTDETSLNTLMSSLQSEGLLHPVGVYGDEIWFIRFQ